MHAAPVQCFLLLTVRLAEAPNPTYALGSGEKYSGNIYQPASPVKCKQDILSPIRSVRFESRQHPKASESTDYHLGPPAPSHIDSTLMEQQVESFTCHKGRTKLADSKSFLMCQNDGIYCFSSHTHSTVCIRIGISVSDEYFARFKTSPHVSKIFHKYFCHSTLR